MIKSNILDVELLEQPVVGVIGICVLVMRFVVVMVVLLFPVVPPLVEIVQAVVNQDVFVAKRLLVKHFINVFKELIVQLKGVSVPPPAVLLLVVVVHLHLHQAHHQVPHLHLHPLPVVGEIAQVNKKHIACMIKDFVLYVSALALALVIISVINVAG